MTQLYFLTCLPVYTPIPDAGVSGSSDLLHPCHNYEANLLVKFENYISFWVL